MKTLSRLALAALLTGAVCLPALAQVQPVVPPPAKTDAGKPATKPAAMTGKVGSHATTTDVTPPASGPVTPKTN